MKAHEIETLLALDALGEATGRKVAEATRYAIGTATAYLNKLRAAGLVEVRREPNGYGPSNWRNVYRVSEAGALFVRNYRLRSP